MKKRIFAAVMLALTVFSAGCDGADSDTSSEMTESEHSEAVSYEADTKKPTIRISGAKPVMVIKKGEEADLMKMWSAEMTGTAILPTESL